MKKILLLLSAICLTLSMKGQSLSGVYTIDNTQPTAGRNFNTFEDAIDALNTQGISAAVTFDITAGQTFNITLTDNSGLRITAGGAVDKPVVFRKSGNAANPLLKVTGTYSYDDYCFYLDGVNYITFDGLDIENAGTSSNNNLECGFYLDDVSNIQLLNCNIRFQNIGYNYGIKTTATVSALLAENITIKKASNGFYLYALGNIVTGSKLLDENDANLTLKNAIKANAPASSESGITITKCEIDSTDTGINCSGTWDNLTISESKITNTTYTGISLDNGNNQYIYNNLIHSLSTGISLSGYNLTDTVYLAYNTVYIPANSVGASNLSKSYNSKVGLYNNIFINKSTNYYSSCFSNSDDNSNILPGSNNNIYFIEQGAVYKNSTVAKYSLNEYIALLGDGRESASHQADILFISTVPPFDFKIKTDVPTKAESGGQSISWVTTDIDGNPRFDDPGYGGPGSATATDIGAYEFDGIKDNTVLSPLSGIYTIDNTQPTDNRNFNSFEDAITTMRRRGISAAVTFDINAGQTFDITLTDSRGFSIVTSGTVDKPIVFRKSGSGANPLLKVTGTNDYDACFYLMDVNYITFDGLDIENAGTSNSDYLEQGYCMLNVSNIQLLNCNIRLRRVGDNYGIYTNGSVSEVNVENVAIRDVERAIYARNNLDSFHAENITVINANYGFFLDCSGTGNTISKSEIDSVGTGIFCYNGTLNNLTISGTKITNATSSGIGLGKGNNQRLYNNLLHTAMSGIFVNNYNYTDTLYVAHNTVYIVESSSQASCLEVSAPYLKTGLYNNIFINKSVSSASNCFKTSSSDNGNILQGSNNNIYFCEYGAVYQNASETAITVHDYVELLGNGRESASQPGTVPFISTVVPLNFDIKTDVPTKAESGGQPLSWVTTDINGKLRQNGGNGSAPDIGAYEFEGIHDNTDYSPLSGVYFINNTLPTADRNFNSFEEAVSALNMQGISAAVTFNVTSGQVHHITLTNNQGLRIVKGGTVDKPIVFCKSGNNDNPLLNVTGTSNSFDACFYLDGVNYITFDGLDIENGGLSSSNNLEVGFNLNNSSTIKILNCNINLQNASNAYGVLAGGDAFYAEHVTVKYAYYGFYFDTPNAINSGNTISKSIIENVNTGIYVKRQNTYYIIPAYDDFTIKETVITNANTGLNLRCGIQRIFNNVIHATSTGILYQPNDLNDTIYLAHNTIYIPATTSSAFGLDIDGKVDIRNNIIINKSTNNAASCIGNSSYGNIDILAGSNNNIYYNAGGSIYRSSSVIMNSLNEYIDMLGNGRESESHREDAPFISVVSPLDFNIKTDVPTKAESGGQDIAWITTDINGNLRANDLSYQGNGSAPDIGAYEFDGISDMMPVAESEYNALKVFFQSTNGANWTRKWDVSTNELHLRAWEGVEVYAGHVVSIELPANNLTGSIPNLDDLPYLHTLDVSNNSISGIEALLPTTITTLQINNQSIEGGEFVLNGKTTEIPVPAISKYNHNSQDFDFNATFDVYLSSTKLNASAWTSANAASFFQNMNENFKILSGTGIELRQTNGNAIGTSITFTIEYRMGDSNIDSLVNVLDIQQTLNYVLMEHPTPFNFSAANLYDDPVVNIQDLVLLVDMIQSNPIETGASIMKNAPLNDYPFRIRNAPEYAELQVDDGIVYLVSPVEVAAFDIRISGASIESIHSLMNNPDIQFSIRKEDDTEQISVLAFSLGGQVIPSGRTPLFTLSKDQMIEQAIMATKSAQPIEVRISNSPTYNDFPTGDKIEIFNAPNPFDVATTFIYYLSEPATLARIKIYSSTGQLVELIDNLPAGQGQHKATYLNTRLPAGIYIYILETFRDNKYSERQTNRMWINK